MSQFKWCFIGAGEISFHVARALNQEKHKVVSIWNRTVAKAVTFSQEFGSNVYHSAEEAMCAPEVMGVYIAVTANKHFEYAMLALKHKKPVLIEKPFTVNSTQSRILIDYAREQQTFLAEAMWTWYAPTANKVKSWIDDHQIGEIKQVDVTYSLPLIHHLKSDRLLDINRTGGALMDIGVYPITYSYYLFGEPKTIKCNGTLKDGIDLGETITMVYNQFECHLDISISDQKGENYIIYGTKGKIEIPWYHMAEDASLNGDKDAHLLMMNYQNKRHLYNYQFDHVTIDINDNKIESSHVPLDKTQRIMELLDECRRQMNVIFPEEKNQSSDE